MPRFLYTLIFLTLSLFGALAYMFFFVPPRSPFIFLLFFGSAHLFSSILISLSIFAFVKNKTNKMYRIIFARLFLLFSPAAGFLVLKAFKAAENVNILLIILLALVSYILLEIKNRLPSRRIL